MYLTYDQNGDFKNNNSPVCLCAILRRAFRSLLAFVAISFNVSQSKANYTKSVHIQSHVRLAFRIGTIDFFRTSILYQLQLQLVLQLQHIFICKKRFACNNLPLLYSLHVQLNSLRDDQDFFIQPASIIFFYIAECICHLKYNLLIYFFM